MQKLLKKTDLKTKITPYFLCQRFRIKLFLVIIMFIKFYMQGSSSSETIWINLFQYIFSNIVQNIIFICTIKYDLFEKYRKQLLLNINLCNYLYYLIFNIRILCRMIGLVKWPSREPSIGTLYYVCFICFLGKYWKMCIEL